MSSRPKHESVPSRPIPPLGMALTLALALNLFSLLPWVRANLRLAASFWGASAAMLALLLIVRYRAARRGRVLTYDVLPRPVHYVQLAMHSSIYLYWGWYWREVYHYLPLILAQIVYVYALDMLVCWLRRDKWILGFGPFPIVLSTNLFLWFKDDWFFLQFLLVSTGVLCKEFVTWDREGRRTHIFNPSAIALAVFSLALIVTRSSQISWAEEVAVTLGRPPNIYIEIVILGLIVQSLFSVTLVTLSAAAGLYVLNLIYTGATGVYYFVDSNIPAAVFLGLHLLVTDPATSPRKSSGKIVFGALYAAAVFGLYSILSWLGAPTFYDKLLCVPLLNLIVQYLDRLDYLPRLTEWTPRGTNFAHMAVWIVLFVVMTSTGFVGGRHPGADPEFWRQACQQGRRNACATRNNNLSIACEHGMGGACLTLGTALAEDHSFAGAGKSFARGCDLQTPGACASLVALMNKEGTTIFDEPCQKNRDGESCFVLASLLYARKDYTRAVQFFRRSCDQGWSRGCGGLGECYRAGQGTPTDIAQAAEYFERACDGGVASSCYSAGLLNRDARDEARAQRHFRQACDLSARYAELSGAYFTSGSRARSETAARFCAEVKN